MTAARQVPGSNLLKTVRLADDFDAPPAEVIGLGIEDALRISGYTRSFLFDEMAAGRIEAPKAGRRTIVLLTSLREHMTTLPRREVTRAQTPPPLPAGSERVA